jgi:hypothetical protein
MARLSPAQRGELRRLRAEARAEAVPEIGASKQRVLTILRVWGPRYPGRWLRVHERTSFYEAAGKLNELTDGRVWLVRAARLMNWLDQLPGCWWENPNDLF